MCVVHMRWRRNAVFASSCWLCILRIESILVPSCLLFSWFDLLGNCNHNPQSLSLAGWGSINVSRCIAEGNRIATTLFAHTNYYHFNNQIEKSLGEDVLTQVFDHVHFG